MNLIYIETSKLKRENKLKQGQKFVGNNLEHPQQVG